MLLLTRRPGQGIWISLEEGVAPSMTVEELFAGGPIKVTLVHIQGNLAKIGIDANRQFRIVRDELLPENAQSLDKINK